MLFLITIRIPKYTKIYQNISKYTKIYQNIPKYIKIYQNISKYNKALNFLFLFMYNNKRWHF